MRPQDWAKLTLLIVSALFAFGAAAPAEEVGTTVRMFCAAAASGCTAGLAFLDKIGSGQKAERRRRQAVPDLADAIEDLSPARRRALLDLLDERGVGRTVTVPVPRAPGGDVGAPHG